MADAASLARESEALARSAVAASVPLVVVDDECRVAQVSPAGLRLLGIDREELIGNPLATVLTPAAADRLVRVWDAFSETGGHAGPFALASPNGSEAIDINVAAAVLPSRHLVVLSASSSIQQAPTISTEAPSSPRGGRAPTPRERQILAMLAAGDTDVEVAARLDRSPATVQTHVRNAKAKLGARTRAQAVALALRQGMIEPQD